MEQGQPDLMGARDVGMTPKQLAEELHSHLKSSGILGSVKASVGPRACTGRLALQAGVDSAQLTLSWRARRASCAPRCYLS